MLAEQAIEGGMKKGAFKLGLNEIIELFKPGGHAADDNISDPQQVARDLASVMRRRPAVQRQESQIYGRRW